WAITGYFGNDLSLANDATKRATIIGWAKSGSAGLDAAFRELESGGAVVKDSLVWLQGIYAYWGEVANRYGMTLSAYEGGAHFVSSGYGADQALVEDFFTRLSNDPRMGDLYAKSLQLFNAAGGDLFMQYVQAA